MEVNKYILIFLAENKKSVKVIAIPSKGQNDLEQGNYNQEDQINIQPNLQSNQNPVGLVNNLNQFRVVEYEDSQQGHQGFEIVLNNSGSVLRYENYPFFRNNNQIVVIDSS
jgi:hypothetical protein